MASLALLWAALASAATSMIVGMLWYGPLLGKPWMKAMGWDSLSKDEIAEKQKGAMPGYMLSMLLAATVSVSIYCILFNWDVYSVMDKLSAPVAGLLMGALGFALFYLPGVVVGTFFESKWTLTFISLGYWGVQYSLYGLWAGVFHAL